MKLRRMNPISHSMADSPTSWKWGGGEKAVPYARTTGNMTLSLTI